MKKISLMAVFFAFVFCLGQGMAFAGDACCPAGSDAKCPMKKGQNFMPKNCKAKTEAPKA